MNDSTDDRAAWAALAELYHRYLTGLLLALVTRVGSEPAAEVVFQTFRRQHHQAFLPGLQKLGLTDHPPAVACAQYHVLSNALGGVNVEWIPESDTRSWVRYRPPRWIFDGTAVCGIPTSLSRAMLRGWHGHNGVSLGNPNLGFVATSQTTDGQAGLVGYYVEEDEPLDPEDRVRFRPGERPPGPAAELPLPSWDPTRLAKVERNYASTYIGTILPAITEVVGPADAAAVGAIAGRQIGMQYHATVMDLLATDKQDRAEPEPFAHRLARLLQGHGTEARAEPGTPEGWSITAEPPRWLADRSHSPAVFEAWAGLWEGLATMEGFRLVHLQRWIDGASHDRWLISPLAGP